MQKNKLLTQHTASFFLKRRQVNWLVAAFLIFTAEPVFAQTAGSQASPQTAGPALTPSARIGPSTRHQVSPLNTYHRVICVVPYVGKGTPEDPKRPMYAPPIWLGNPHLNPSAAAAPSRAGIIGFKQLSTDDHTLAIVEFVAVNRAALAPILADKTILSFEKDKHSRSEIETALRKVRKGFVLEHLGATAQ